MMSTTVLLHHAARGQWLSFRQPVQVLAAYAVDDVLPALREAEATVDGQERYAAGFISYEAAPAFDPSFQVRPAPADFPLLWFGLYAQPEIVPAPVPPAGALPLGGEWAPSVSRAEYAAAIDCVKAHIAHGDTYQVNYTFRLRRAFDGDPLALFAAVRQGASGRNRMFDRLSDHFLTGSYDPAAFALRLLHKDVSLAVGLGLLTLAGWLALRGARALLRGGRSGTRSCSTSSRMWR